MKLNSLLSVSLLAALTSITTSAQTPSRLTFEQRVEAQRAIERVYYSHQTSATAPFEDAVTLDTLERKVRAYLGKSIALERYWHTPITAEMLAVEARRIATSTRMPERLREILAALDDDSELILECLVRPALADRLSRAAFGADSSIHATQRAEAEEIHARLETGTLDPVADEPRRTIVDLVHGDTPAQNPAAAVPVGIMSIPLGEEEFRVQRDRAPRAVGAIGPVVDQGDQFTIRIALDEDDRHARVATYAVAKRSWDDWWSTVEKDLDGQEPAPLTLPQIDFTELSKTMPETPATCPPDDLWDNQLLGQSAPEPLPRFSASAIWTGTRMIVWGGRGTVVVNASDCMDTGDIYDPATNTWQQMSTVNAPIGRVSHSAIWTGSRMIVFGGQVIPRTSPPTPNITLGTGGIYDPVTDTWVSMSPASQARAGHTAVWTGSEMIVWGGGANDTTIDTGERYNVATNSWSPLSQTNAPSKRSGHTAVWTGSEMLVWGGYSSTSTLLNDGRRYSPQTNTWSPMSTINAPEARGGHMAIWTGSRMVVLGGGKLNGGRYNPGNDQWAVATIQDVRSAPAVWTGSLILVWGGADSFGPLRSGYSYNPVNDTVTSISTEGAPVGRTGNVAAWTGSEMVISHGQKVGRTYGRYNPITDTWAAYAPYSSPSSRYGHTAVWTGSLMVVWGGGETWSLALTGYRYDPAIDAWSLVSSANAPAPRYRHTAVWTGSRMIVWGGFLFPNAVSWGGLYDPIADSWTNMTDTIPPRLYHTALWTGSRMLIWGGAGTELTPFAYYYVPRNDGASYDPQTDLWEPTPTSNAPAPRYLHTAVWTGSKMLVWGGCSSQSGNGDCGQAIFGDGRAFDPGTNLWTVINPTGAPIARRSHTAVWDGNRMLVWGGTDRTAWHTADLADGAAYNPSTDGWTVLSTIGAPAARFSHSAIWTGREMLIWGGGETIPDPSSGVRFVTFNTGARYNPMVDAWTPMSLTNAPLARYEHSAIFADSSMIVWGGEASYGTEELSDGGRYLVDTSPDADGDGLSICKGDCDDTHATVRPGGPKVCDGLNNNCADPSWPALPANESDDDGDALSECQADCDDARATVYPGAPQLCDGINDNCSEPGWPALSSPESDQDGDSRYFCQTLSNDCNDANAQVWSAPTEVPALDWVDSQSMSWQAPADPGGSSVSFDTLRAAISSDFTGATTCVESDDSADTHADDPTLPVPGQTFFYLVRAENSCPAGQNMGPLGYRSDGTPIAGRVCP